MSRVNNSDPASKLQRGFNFEQRTGSRSPLIHPSMYLCRASVQPKAGLFGNGALTTFQWSISGERQDWKCRWKENLLLPLALHHSSLPYGASSSFAVSWLPPSSPQISCEYLGSLIYTGLPNSNRNYQPCLRETAKPKVTPVSCCQSPHKLKWNLIWRQRICFELVIASIENIFFFFATK